MPRHSKRTDLKDWLAIRARYWKPRNMWAWGLPVLGMVAMIGLGVDSLGWWVLFPAIMWGLLIYVFGVKEYKDGNDEGWAECFANVLRASLLEADHQKQDALLTSALNGAWKDGTYYASRDE